MCKTLPKETEAILKLFQSDAFTEGVLSFQSIMTFFLPFKQIDFFVHTIKINAVQCGVLLDPTDFPCMDKSSSLFFEIPFLVFHRKKRNPYRFGGWINDEFLFLGELSLKIQFLFTCWKTKPYVILWVHLFSKWLETKDTIFLSRHL